MKRYSCFLTLLVLAFVTSCMPGSLSPANEPKVETPGSAPKAGEGDGKWGTIKGRITWGGGDIPKSAVLDTAKEPKCVAKDGGAITSQDWVINAKNKGVRYVCVWLRAEQDNVKLPVHPDLEKVKDEKVEIDQPCCMFEPHGLALRKGQVLVIKNPEKEIAHNFDWKGLRPSQGNNTLIPAGGKIDLEIKPSEFPIKVNCGIHPWMKGWVRVFDHPYFDVTDANGKFEIKNAPAGKFRIVIWHDEGGWRNQETKKLGDPIEIKAGENDVGTLEIKPLKE